MQQTWQKEEVERLVQLSQSYEFGIKSYEKLYSSCVVPILDYQSSIWGYKDYNDIDSVQNRSIRYFLGVHRFAPKLAINGDVGWMPAKELRWFNMLRYWNRLVRGLSGKFVDTYDYSLKCS